jgi:hypothetical protein
MAFKPSAFLTVSLQTCGDCPAKTKVFQKKYQATGIALVFSYWAFLWIVKEPPSFKWQNPVSLV